MIAGNFAYKRAKADDELIRNGQQPTIYDIYDYMGEFSPDNEIEMERDLLIRRETVCEMLDYAHKSGKDVYIVSDMYLTGDIIFDLLSSLNVNVKRENILVSCDYKTSKWSGGLYDVLREKVGDKKILHIGDNYESDIKRACERSVNDVFQVESAIKMLEDSYAEKLLKCENTLVNRMLIGEFIGRQLNSPFLFSETAGKFSINSNREMAYSFIAPTIYLFFSWLIKKADELGLGLILLPSRDGFIIEKIYNIFREHNENLPQMKYFYVSRAAATLAGITNDEDILGAAKLEYAGTMKDMLKTRFHLRDDEIAEQGDCDDEDYVLKHRKAILREARRAYENYRKYVSKFKIANGDTVGYMDFIAVGNCQRFLGKVLDFKLHGLYFATYNIENSFKYEITVDSLMEILNCFQFSNNIFEMQFMLEPIITSPEPTLSHFDENGEPVFFEDYRNRKNLADLAEIIEGIVDYVTNSKVRLNELNAEAFSLIDMLISLVKPKYSVIHTDYFDNIEMKDPFNNRTFSFRLD
jgi:predicted HAD superfamily hydrolase